MIIIRAIFMIPISTPATTAMIAALVQDLYCIFNDCPSRVFRWTSRARRRNNSINGIPI